MESHPAWVCGLKPQPDCHAGRALLSHPAWVCGLKPVTRDNGHLVQRHTLRGCVD